MRTSFGAVLSMATRLAGPGISPFASPACCEAGLLPACWLALRKSASILSWSSRCCARIWFCARSSATCWFRPMISFPAASDPPSDASWAGRLAAAACRAASSFSSACFCASASFSCRVSSPICPAVCCGAGAGTGAGIERRCESLPMMFSSANLSSRLVSEAGAWQRKT